MESVKPGRSPHGERGLKLISGDGCRAAGGRSPHGERGLKYEITVGDCLVLVVALLMESVD